MTELKCPFCGEILQKYGEVDPDTGTSTVLGANCSKCGIGDSDIKLWQALIDTKKKLDIAVEALKCICEQGMSLKQFEIPRHVIMLEEASEALEQINEIKGDKDER